MKLLLLGLLSDYFLSGGRHYPSTRNSRELSRMSVSPLGILNPRDSSNRESGMWLIVSVLNGKNLRTPRPN